jgi:hypothetical protein
MDDMNWGNPPQYQAPEAHGHDRHKALRWTAGIIAAVVLAGGGAIVGVDLLGGNQQSSAPAGYSVGTAASGSPDGPADGGQADGGQADGGQAAALGAILATAGSPAADTSGTVAGAAAKRVRGRHVARIVRRLRGVHGEFTVRKPGGGFREIAFERGTVVSANGGNVVVHAPDGTTWTWTLTSDTVVRKDRAKSSASSLAAGDLVFAAGTVSGSVRDALLVIARDKKAAASSQGPSGQSSAT